MKGQIKTHFCEICVALGVVPPPKGSMTGDRCYFGKDVKIPHPSGKVKTEFVNSYKAEHFLLEAKQGSTIAENILRR
jgi:hypothetical protein